MSQTITVRIAGKGPDTDAPTVGDLLDQLRDFFDLLGIVEETLAGDGQSAIQWRVVNATTASPLTFTIQAFARQYALNVDRRAGIVANHVSQGLAELQQKPEKPAYFSERALQKAERIFDRVTNGLDLTEIETGGSDRPPIDLTPSVARVAARNTRAVLEPTAKPYKEVGCIEGHVQSVSEDGWGHRVVHLKYRLTGDEVKCFVTDDAEKEFAQREISDVWHHRRVSMFGVIHYKAPGRINYVEATSVRFLRSRSELPDVDDIIDPNFTGGLKSEDYLDKLRNGDLP